MAGSMLPGAGAMCCSFAVLGALWLCGTSQAGRVHEVLAANHEFSPDALNVQSGDTIRWMWGDEFHTVTSGTGCIFDGDFFNAPLNPVVQMFEWTVPDGFAGQIPYFCLPHCTMGMTGMIVVQDMTSAADLTGDGSVNAADLAILLGAWSVPAGSPGCDGEEPCAADLNHDRVVNAADLALLLGAWG